MSASAALRLQIETTLANRVPAALTLKIKQAPELFATGTSEVDADLGGGIRLDLQNYGIDETLIFPDLEGLGRALVTSRFANKLCLLRSSASISIPRPASAALARTAVPTTSSCG